MPERQGHPFVTLLLVAVVAGGAALIVTASYEFSHERIAANERARLLDRLHSVLDPQVQARNPNPVRISVRAPELLGTDSEVDVFVAIDEAGRPLATIIASVARNGYNAPIQLLVGIAPDGRLTGVRVVSHRETPGLGDAIEIEKSDWILQFDGRRLGDPPRELWAVDRDEGVFDSITGATVTPRAVVEAVRGTLEYFEANSRSLYAAARQVAREAEGAGND